MTWIKICGITNLEDALTAVNAGADALGFVFYEKSPRYVKAETVREIVRQLPEQLEKVGVFAEDDWEHVVDTGQKAQLTAMQLSAGQVNISACAAILDHAKLYVAFAAAKVANQGFEMQKVLSAWHKHPGDSVSAFFLDSSTDSQPGGTGKTFDWEKAAPVAKMIRRRFNLVIAGGLNPANVVEAIRTFKPWGVDVSSGVEAQPGKKDPEKVRAFVAAVRRAEQTP